mmetsp:Transcript_13178/g.48053  ORF Transcript_13178/g.48053 Transcript_13178/m.48053 type:complete len:104 (-) Transcript_13178:143-454(-)|eukprot:scaffold427_cov344-Prasinococcus_capsulatus_cf.AAC.6
MVCPACMTALAIQIASVAGPAAGVGVLGSKALRRFRNNGGNSTDGKLPSTQAPTNTASASPAATTKAMRGAGSTARALDMRRASTTQMARARCCASRAAGIRR